MVPPVVALMIKARQLFNYQPSVPVAAPVRELQMAG